MITVLLVVLIAAAALGVATLVNRRRPDAPSIPTFALPQQLDRDDFGAPDHEWLVVLFTSATCVSCRDARDVITPVRQTGVAVVDVEFEKARPLHERYGIDGVPATVLADREGVVRWSFLGVPPLGAIAEMLETAGVAPPDSGTAVDLP